MVVALYVPSQDQLRNVSTTLHKLLTAADARGRSQHYYIKLPGTTTTSNCQFVLLLERSVCCLRKTSHEGFVVGYTEDSADTYHPWRASGQATTSSSFSIAANSSNHALGSLLLIYMSHKHMQEEPNIAVPADTPRLARSAATESAC